MPHLMLYKLPGLGVYVTVQHKTKMLWKGVMEKNGNKALGEKWGGRK